MRVLRSSPLCTGRLYPQELSWYSFLEAESTPGHIAPSVASEKKSPATPPAIDPETFQLVAQSLNHYATQVPLLYMYTAHNPQNSLLLGLTAILMAVTFHLNPISKIKWHKAIPPTATQNYTSYPLLYSLNIKNFPCCLRDSHLYGSLPGLR
jgi:hypothetical protein